MADDKLHELDLARVEHDGRIKRLEEWAESSVTKDQFTPVRTLVYGLAGLILTGFATALLQVVNK